MKVKLVIYNKSAHRKNCAACKIPNLAWEYLLNEDAARAVVEHVRNGNIMPLHCVQCNYQMEFTKSEIDTAIFDTNQPIIKFGTFKHIKTERTK